MSTISKIQSSVAFPLSAQGSNQIYWNIGQQDSVISLKDSYIEMELNVNGLVGVTGLPTTDTHNLVLGHDGLFYEPSSIVRMAQLVDNSNGRQIQNLNYVNIIDNALKYYAKGSNEMVSDAIYSGAGHKGTDGSIVSIFSNDYPDANPVLKVPLSSVLCGSLGQSDAFSQGGDLTLRLLLEPQYDLFMRAVPSRLYSEATIAEGTTQYAFNNLNATLTTLQASALGTMVNIADDDFVMISGNVGGGGGPELFFRQVTNVVADAGVTAGNFTIDSALSASQAVSAIEVTIVNKDYVLGCQGITDSTATLTLDTPYAVAGSDISVGTVCNVFYNEQTVNISTGLNEIGPQKSVKRTVSALTIPTDAITAVTLNLPIVSPASGGVRNIYIVPLYTNSAAKWSVVNSNVILYRRNMSVKAPQKMLLSAFESSGVQCPEGLKRFVYNFKVDNNCYNSYVLTPNQTNLYPQIQNFDSYLFTVDETPLSSIYIDAPASAVHIDNLSKVLQNSSTYQPKNLSQNRDKEIESDVLPSIFPAKICSSMIKGEPMLQPEGVDRNLRVELVADAGTLLTTVFMFQEKWVQV
jgi:hypothetical protein